MTVAPETLVEAPFHRPVLAAAVAAWAAGTTRAVDATVGGGGHASLLRAGAANPPLLAIDRDAEALAAARARLGDQGFTYLHARFADDDALAAISAFRPDRILLDLGLSSHQIDRLERGFSFRPGAPLDMRMTVARKGEEGRTAAQALNQAPAEELERWFREFADQTPGRARKLAKEIVRRRATQPFRVSDDLVNAIRAVLGSRSGPADFARLFQAVRIAVNDEMEQLARALPAMRDALVPGGSLAVITYHSGEDRTVKHQFREWARPCICPPRQPVCTCRGRPLGKVVAPRGVKPDAQEVAANPRARSARLRVFETAASP
ncbi:MAG: 16S rRNA (cytosine(1402)-N(4))-methyltransferase RsmH [Gemmatimonadales bacterium]